MINKFSAEYEFLSNFSQHEVIYEGIQYPTSEHAFQAAKSLDKGEKLRIKNAKTPGLAKRMGSKVKLRNRWDHIRIKVMEDILRDKFNRHPDIKQKLLNTGNKTLVEGNTWGDSFWGIYNDSGKNWLGKILMKIRSELNTEITGVVTKKD